MTTRSSVLRNASARIEALEARSLLSGEIDVAFGIDGAAFASDTDFKAVAIQADGKVVVASALTGKSDAVITRYTAAGAVDKTFNGTGRLVLSGVKADRIDSVTALSSGKILVGGQNYIRLNGNGTLDKTYGGGDGIAPSILAGDRRAAQSTVVLADGSVLELGDNAANGQNRVYKYKADGSLDKTFGSGGSFNLATLKDASTGAITTDGSGRIYVGFVDAFGTLFTTRLTAAGKLDSAYGNKGVAMGTTSRVAAVRSIAVLGDGTVATLFAYSAHGAYFGIDSFRQTGAYQGSQSGLNSLGGVRFYASKLNVAKDGSLFVGGTYNLGPADDEQGPDTPLPLRDYAAVVHLNRDLSLDTTYSVNKDGVGGYSVNGVDTRYVASAVDSSGRVVLLGETNNSARDNTFTRLTAPGTSNRVSYTKSEHNFVFTGTNGVDNVRLQDVFNPDTLTYNREIAFDNGPAVQSADVLIDLTITGNWTFNLLGGNDEFDGRYGSDRNVTVNAGAGNDIVYGGSRAGFVIYGDDGDDILSDVGTQATIHGGAGDDQIVVGNYAGAYGDAGNDTISDLGGYSTLYGGEGDDTFGHANATLPATINGGAGNDYAVYSSMDTLIDIETRRQVG